MVLSVAIHFKLDSEALRPLCPDLADNLAKVLVGSYICSFPSLSIREVVLLEARRGFSCNQIADLASRDIAEDQRQIYRHRRQILLQFNQHNDELDRVSGLLFNLVENWGQAGVRHGLVFLLSCKDSQA